MIDVKGAVDLAMEHMKTLIPGHKFSLTLEEVLISDDGKNWLITIGYPASTSTIFTSATDMKEYKTIALDKETGNFVSMKIRRV